jgi:hypothetical protein
MSLRQCRITRVARMTVDPSGYCHMLENVDDRCQAIASDPECSSFPREEVVDGVTTINNFVVTGLAPSLSCRDFTTTLQASCNYVCPGDGGWQIPCLNNPGLHCRRPHGCLLRRVCPLDAAVTCSSAPTCIANGEARLCQVQYSIQRRQAGGPTASMSSRAGNSSVSIRAPLPSCASRIRPCPAWIGEAGGITAIWVTADTEPASTSTDDRNRTCDLCARHDAHSPGGRSQLFVRLGLRGGECLWSRSGILWGKGQFHHRRRNGNRSLGGHFCRPLPEQREHERIVSLDQRHRAQPSRR